jgi:hypothetical protein
MGSDPNATDTGMEYQFTPIWQIMLSVMKDWFTSNNKSSKVPANIQQILMTTLPVEYQNATNIQNWFAYPYISGSMFPNFLQMIQTSYARFAVVGSTDSTFINANPFKISQPGVNGLDFEIKWKQTVGKPFPIPGTNSNLFYLIDCTDSGGCYQMGFASLGTLAACNVNDIFLGPNWKQTAGANFPFQLTGPNSDGSYGLQISLDNGNSFVQLYVKNCVDWAYYLSPSPDNAICPLHVIFEQVPGPLDQDGYFSYKMNAVGCPQPFSIGALAGINDGDFNNNLVYGQALKRYRKKHGAKPTVVQLQLINPAPWIYPSWTCPVPVICTNKNSPFNVGLSMPCDSGYCTGYGDVQSNQVSGFCFNDCDSVDDCCPNPPCDSSQCVKGECQ